LQAVRRYTEIFDLPRTISRFPLRDALSAARVSISGDCTLGVGDLPDVDADARRLQLLFKELLSNACKFHGGGIPEVGISVTNSREGLVVSFDDNGIGIEPNQVERIFVPFVRLLGDRFPGAGMGLAIARELVEGWGGRIWVESRPGAGSSFRFTLPHG
jgi:signal transduction histidine kinase